MVTFKHTRPFVLASLLCAAPAVAQRAVPAAEFRRAPEWAAASGARDVQALQRSFVAGRSAADTGQGTRRRSRRLIGGIVGGLLGGAVGGVLGVRASAVGCDAMVGTDCRRPRHTWAYPVVGAGVGASLGVAWGVLRDRAVEPSS